MKKQIRVTWGFILLLTLLGIGHLNSAVSEISESAESLHWLLLLHLGTHALLVAKHISESIELSLTHFQYKNNKI